tara:strand:- start:383 stop:670 length:288 start_codon:yes stop_codon:yes gene_type:complete
MKDLNYYKNNCEENYITTPISVLRYITELEKDNESKQLILSGVSKSSPTIIEIDFDGHLKCQIETTDKALTILKAVNGYGHPVDCNKDKIRINEI